MEVTNTFKHINTSNIESNVVSGMEDIDEARKYSAILSMYSFVVQFAVKTHDEGLSDLERGKFSQMQGQAETKLASSLSELGRNNAKNQASIVRAAFLAGFVVGSLVLALAIYLIG
ncbi:hypothetical protein MJO52_05130 [Microbulbifer variabilis]|uniref:Uncharacterized protein n=1 Tax=Microbulbifer variabilis TaxID=266805 RepID=A0ABY4VI57_9GAMM|nr:hypothetical protein [Microbulbifer variabilis]USD22515.1 hypothetical protein MJO52_05130 [Microbulbifer variabilis]